MIYSNFWIPISNFAEKAICIPTKASTSGEVRNLDKILIISMVLYYRIENKSQCPLQALGKALNDILGCNIVCKIKKELLAFLALTKGFKVLSIQGYVYQTNLRIS